MSVFIAYGATAQSRSDKLLNAVSASAPKSDELQINYIDLTSANPAAPPRFQKGQRTNQLKTAQAFEHTRFARRLGSINAISAGANGELYVSDAESGRVFILPDRDQNGRPEQIRPIPYRFDRPSAVVELGDYLYIADRAALWKYKAGSPPVAIASLQNIPSTGRYFLHAPSNRIDPAKTDPAKAGPAQAGDKVQTQRLTLGYTTQTGDSRTVSINPQTGIASPLAQASGELIDVTSDINGVLWTALRSGNKLHIGRGLSAGSALPIDFAASSIALGQGRALPADWPAALRDHIFISRNNPVDVIAVPTSLGAVLPKGVNIISGFQVGRTAWGRAGALHVDTRGLFVADPFNGDLWLIRPKPKTFTREDRRKGRLGEAVDNLKQAQDKQEAPLKRNPLANIYESLIPDAPDPIAPDPIVPRPIVPGPTAPANKPEP